MRILFFAIILAALPITMSSTMSSADPLPQDDPIAPFDPVAILTGTVTVVHDGSDLGFGDVRIGLQGIVAPEDRPSKSEEGGPQATAALTALALGRQVTCYLDGTPTPKTGSFRLAAMCFVDGTDLGRTLVRAGVVRDCPFFSGRRYLNEEDAALAHDLTPQPINLPDLCHGVTKD